MVSDYRMEKQPKCPHCGSVVRDSWEIFKEMEQEVETDCGSCEEPFTISREVIFYYSATCAVKP